MLVLVVEDEDTPANNPVTGLTCQVAIRRLSDGKWYDFVANAWDTVASYGSLAASNVQALTDNTDGTYSVEWDQAEADASAEREYVMTYEVTAGTNYVGRMDSDEWFFNAPVGTATLDITVKDESGAEVPSCPVVIRNASELTLIAGPSRTDQDGLVAFELEPGSYKIRLGPLPGYDFSELTGTDGTTIGSGLPYAYTLAADADLQLNCQTSAQRFEGYTFQDLQVAVATQVEIRYLEKAVPQAMIQLWIRAAIAEIDARLGWSKGILTFASAADQANYRLWEAPRQVQAVVYEGDDGTTPLVRIPWEEYLELVARDDTAGDPAKWSRWADDVYLYPAPDTTGDTITVYMTQGAPLLSAGNDTPAIPPQYHRAVVELALSLACADLPGLEAASSVYLQRFEAAMNALKPLPDPGRSVGKMRIVPGG